MATPQYKDEVLVTLKSVDPPSSFAFPKRQILLSKENPTMDIGRTSKRNSSLEAAKNNAWFDSAVMSRDHARLTLDVDNFKVFINDIGSLHGTFHNGDRLSRQTPSQLNNGDTIKFGIPIERGADKYPPCVMETHLEFGNLSPQDRPQVFRVPDESDAEESCSETDEIIHHSAKVVRKIMIPTWTSRYGRDNQSQQVDLTMDEQYPISDVRDDQRPTNSTDPSSSDIIERGKETACVDLTGMSEDDTDRIGSQSTQANQVTFDSTSWFSNAHLSPEAESRALGYQTSISSGSGEEDEDISDLDNVINSDESDESDESDDSQDLDLDINEEFPEGDFEELDEFEDEDMNDSMDPTLCAFSDLLDHTDTTPLPIIQETQPPASFSVSQTPLVTAPELDVTLATNGPFTQLPSIRDAGNQLPEFAPKHWTSLSSCKLPSLLEATSQAVKPVPQNSQLSQVLAEKTGKHAYFEAREENRIRVIDCRSQSAQATPTADGLHEHRNMTSTLSPLSSKSIMLDFEPQSVSLKGYEEDNAAGSIALLIPMGSGPEPNESPLTPDSSKSCGPPKYAQPSAFDAASAYELEKMRLEAKKAQNSQQPPTEKTLAVEEVGSGAPKSLKRKADDFSQLTREEELSEALSVHRDQPQTTQQPTRNRICSNHSFSNGKRLRSSTTRPNKRLRRFAEAFGYVALGGVAVMSALIATAPTL